MMPVRARGAGGQGPEGQGVGGSGSGSGLGSGLGHGREREDALEKRQSLCGPRREGLCELARQISSRRDPLWASSRGHLAPPPMEVSTPQRIAIFAWAQGGAGVEEAAARGGCGYGEAWRARWRAVAVLLFSLLVAVQPRCSRGAAKVQPRSCSPLQSRGAACHRLPVHDAAPPSCGRERGAGGGPRWGCGGAEQNAARRGVAARCEGTVWLAQV